MAVDKLKVGQAFLTDLLARVPEASRAAVEEALTAPEAQAAVEFAGESAFRQQDYSRYMNEVKAQEDALLAKHQELTDWYEQNKAALAAAAKPANPAPTSGQPTGIDRKTVEDLMTEREQGVGSFVVATTGLALKHFKEFNEALDLTELLTDPQVKKIGILGVYDQKYAARYAEKAAAAEKARIDAAVEARVAEERRKFASAPPYPVVGGDPSPLDALESTSGQPQFTAQAAADEYTALVAKRLQQGSPG